MKNSKLSELLNRKNQRFICSPAGGETEEHKLFTAHIVHEVTPPLTEVQLKQLEEHIGYHNQLFELFKKYGSVRLYCDTLSDESAYYLATPNEWTGLYDDFHMWVESLKDDERKELLPKWLDSALVIGEAPSSGNFYLLPLKGNEKGKIFEFDHDGFEFVEVGKDLFSFIDKICTVTDDLINNILSHTRYSDGKTKIQWLVKKYEFDN